MFSKKMIPSFLMGNINPLHYYSHLSNKDKRFMMEVFLPSCNLYSTDNPLTFPENPIKSVSSVESKYKFPNILRLFLFM